MTLQITITTSVEISDAQLLSEIVPMDEKQRAAWAETASQKAHNRVANWFKGHAARIAVRAELTNR